MRCSNQPKTCWIRVVNCTAAGNKNCERQSIKQLLQCFFVVVHTLREHLFLRPDLKLDQKCWNLAMLLSKPGDMHKHIENMALPM
ncbi:hypothetical protein D3C81_1986110 [compost metagenome]